METHRTCSHEGESEAFKREWKLAGGEETDGQLRWHGLEGTTATKHDLLLFLYSILAVLVLSLCFWFFHFCLVFKREVMNNGDMVLNIVEFVWFCVGEKQGRWSEARSSLAVVWLLLFSLLSLFFFFWYL
jgi:hypothetical protein